MLYKFDPPDLPGLTMTLRAKVALRELSDGRQELGFEFSLRGFDLRSPPQKLYLECDRGIDPTIVHNALGAGINPILAILINQNAVAEEFFHGGGDGLLQWLEGQALLSDVPAAKKSTAATAGRI